MEFVVLHDGSRNICAMEPSRRWGDDRAILDDEEARRRILDAAGRCIVQRGNTQFRWARWPTRRGCRGPRSTDISRPRRRPARPDPDAGRSRPGRVGRARWPLPTIPCRSRSRDGAGPRRVGGRRSAERGAVRRGEHRRGDGPEKGSEPIVETLLRHYEPLLHRWKSGGRLHADLDPVLGGPMAARDHVVSARALVAIPARAADKREFVEQFVVRALVPQIRQ